MPDRPNILLIMSDQHHAGFMGCTGDRYAHTPALDALAARGTRFSQTYCPFPLCGPSRMSFMTGRTCSDIGIWTNDQQLPSDVPTFAHGLLSAGYDTVLAGRMHFVGLDQRHGFQQRIISDVPETAHIAHSWRLNRVLGDLIDTPGMNLAGVVKSGPGHSGYIAYDQAVTHTAVSWLEQRGRTGGESPFLLTVGYVLPHCPFVAPPDDFARYEHQVKLSDLPEVEAQQHPAFAEQRRRFQVDPLPPVEAQWRTRVAYYGMCTFVDRQIAAVLGALEAAGLADNTIVIYTSDHGEMLGEHGSWWKSCFYDGSARVPLIIAEPGQRGGRTLPWLTNLMDIGPTLLDLAGAAPLPGATGRSLVPLLRGREQNWDDVTTSENVMRFDGRPVPCRMVRRGPWKLNHYHGMRPELFHLLDDPGELHDRWNDPACAAIRDGLQVLALRDWDAQRVIDGLDAWSAAKPMIARWIAAAKPIEPDPCWFTQPPENRWEPVLPPGSRR